MVKPDLIVFDVDGTLLDDGAEVPETSAALMRLAKRVPCLLSTGRAPHSLLRWASHWGLPGPHGTCNGAILASTDGRTEVLATLANDVRDGIIDELMARSLPILVFLSDGSIRTPVADPRVNIVAQFDEPIPEVGGIDRLPAVKVITVANRETETGLRDLYDDHTIFQRTHEWFVEWNPLESSKGLALAQQIERLGIDPSHVMAVGDSENDASMLRLANHGVAIQHAAIEAKEAADEILTTPIHEWMDQIG